MLPTCLLLCLALAPGDPSEVELASALARRGWIDLADELCSRIEHLSGASVVLAEVAVARARQQPDPGVAVKVLDAAIARLGTRPTAEETTMAGFLRAEKARRLGDAQEAAKAWEEVEAFYQASIVELQKVPAGPTAEEALLDARLEMAKAMTARARLIVGNDSLRRKLLDQAIHLYLDFQLDTGTRPIAYEAILEEGLARADLRESARAERCFRAVMALKKKGAVLAEYPSSLVDHASLALLRLLTGTGKGKEAVAAADLLLKEHPARMKTAFGLAVQLAKAEALASAGDHAGAILLAQMIAGADPGGPSGSAALGRIREWTVNGGATAAQMLLIADGLMDRGLFWEALVDLRRCVEACADAADRAKHAPLASFKRGECFRSLKREAEASLSFQEVFRKYPKHELAQRAAFEAVRALIRSAASTRDRRDEEQQEALLKEIEERGLQGAFADFFTFLKAESLERQGKWKAAAEEYQKVGIGCDVYDDALISAGHCLRRDVDAKGDPKQLETAERLLRRASERLEKSVQRKLRVAAQFELAIILLHDTVNKPGEALDFILRCAALLPAESTLLPRLAELEIRARLSSGDGAGASARLDRLLAATDGGAAAVRSARRVAAWLEAKDPAGAARYFRVWLDRAATEETSSGDVKAVADGLYRLARRFNKLDPKAVSVLDLRGKPVADRSIWGDAARAQELWKALPGLSAEERNSAESRVICCWGLAAEAVADWDRVKRHCEALIQEYGLQAVDGLQAEVLRKQGWLAGICLEYGHALYQLGKAGQKFQYGNALKIFTDLALVSKKESEPWWVCQAMILRIRFDRGESADLRVADAMSSLLVGDYPQFDEGKFGLKDLLIELRSQIQAAQGGRR